MAREIAVIAVAVVVGIHWNCDWGWFIVAIVAVFIINLIKDKEYEQKDSEDQR